MIVDKPEQTDGYHGLYGEVVTSDCYRLKTIKFTPDVILDLGGNIGIFARFARSLFPDALIVSVEPNPENCIHFEKFTPNDDKIILLETAIGFGMMWRCLNAINGAHESYLSAGLGYDEKDMTGQENISLEKSLVPMVMIDELIDFYIKPNQKSIVKIDIEGGENAIFIHKPSLNALKRIDYIAMEIHWYALSGGPVWQQVQTITREALQTLKETHYCELNNTEFFAIKK